MKKATINLTGCRSVRDLHKRVREGLGFPDYYGNNLDAFWDCLHLDCEASLVTVIGSERVADDVKTTVLEIVELLEKNKAEWANTDQPFDYEIQP